MMKGLHYVSDGKGGYVIVKGVLGILLQAVRNGETFDAKNDSSLSSQMEKVDSEVRYDTCPDTKSK